MPIFSRKEDTEERGFNLCKERMDNRVDLSHTEARFLCHVWPASPLRS